jgi:transposase-like protein
MNDVKIIRCPNCGHESRASSGWVRSHITFQCDGCGDQFNLHDSKIRKAFDAVRRKLTR